MVNVNSHQFIREFNATVSEFFKGLTFNADRHEYYVEGKKTPTSVSGVVKGFVVPTDFDAIAVAIDRRDNLPAGTTKALWAAKTAKACADGTKTHDFGENFIEEGLTAESEKEKAVQLFWYQLERDHPGRYILMAKELKMYHKIFLFPGTGDFILYDRLLKKFIVGDYKTNEDLFKNHKGKMLAEPFDHLLDCPYNHYQIQLSLYQLLLQQIEGYEVADRWIVYLQSDGKYKVHPTYDYVSILEEWLQENINTQKLSLAK